MRTRRKGCLGDVKKCVFGECVECTLPKCKYDMTSKELKKLYAERNSEINKYNKDYSKSYYEKNRVKILEKRKKYRETHSDEIKAYQKGYANRTKEDEND